MIELVGGRMDGLHISGWGEDDVKVPKLQSLVGAARHAQECDPIPTPELKYDLYRYTGCKRHDGTGWLKIYLLQQEETNAEG